MVGKLDIICAAFRNIVDHSILARVTLPMISRWTFAPIPEEHIPIGPSDTPLSFRVDDFLTELRNVPFLLGSKGGVPRRKGSFERQRGRHSGMHFKWTHLRLKPWYVCPLCAEPKQAEQVCRKEICRRVRP
ncbi:hypothetical protein XU18_2878 [Perkinsela sp. CCAP 1560/4]|nr:hypothetical protein XU18_2878 [Perkinsela sp. CCAP 1560/4]|eukprot:KNH06373.1 hypothetical protein XU18_2878 [Perkinsela sp. CCAP 1560/4]